MNAAPRARVQRRPVHGVLLLDKPLGPSSNQALQKAKWLLRAEKAGHTGTLDPLATGVLPLCFGAATKFSQLHLDADKFYETEVRLGVRTSSADAEGEVLETLPVTCSLGQVVEVIDRFTGPISQVPPMHSALKKDGKALYEYAREGQTVERAPRSALIHELELLQAQLEGATPFLRLRVHCSKGTYIRTLGEDIGKALGCGAHLSALRRVQTGPFEASQCHSIEQLESMDEVQRLHALQPIACLLNDHVRIALGTQDAGRFLSGMRRRGSWPDAERVAVFAPPLARAAEWGWGQVETASSTHTPSPKQSPKASRAEAADLESRSSETASSWSDGVLLGTGHVKAGELIPGRLLSPLEIQQILESEPHVKASMA